MTGDLGGEAEFLFGFDVVGGEQTDDGLAGGFPVARGGGEEVVEEAGQDGFQEDGGDVGEGVHGGLTNDK